MVTAKQLANLKKDDFNITPDNAREMQAKGVAKRKENRTVREIYMDKLAKGERKGNIIEKVLEQAEQGNLAAYDRMIRDLQEDGGAKGVAQGLFIVTSEETAEKLSRL